VSAHQSVVLDAGYRLAEHLGRHADSTAPDTLARTEVSSLLPVVMPTPPHQTPWPARK
jgi:hypothetical protein